MKSPLNIAAMKYIIGWLVVFAIRLIPIPFRPPNIEPILATTMPFAKQFGAIGAFIFGFFSIALFDLATMKVGIWTLITALAYGTLGIGAYYFFKNRKSSAKNYVLYAIPATLFYDAITGLSVGPLFFGQSLTEAFVGQIPFTLWHLAGNIVFAALLSPLIYTLVVKNPRLTFSIGKIQGA